MRPSFQADENLNAKIIAGLSVGNHLWISNPANLLGLTDPEVLAIAARDRRILVSHDRETMPAHFSRFVADPTSAGLLIVSQKLDVREAIEFVLLIWAATEAEEWINRIGYIPF